ncbi:MAG TPA: hypothetical protein DCG48_08015, partial [Rhodospirillaceae bacterium]|nr:hypothetical protein [Rhodospirillaceae bacterium]
MRASALALGLGLTAGVLGLPASAHAQSAIQQWQRQMDPAGHAHILGNYDDAEDHYRAALDLV